MTPAEPVVQVGPRLDHDTRTQVLDVVASASEADGVHPLSEHVSLHLRHGGDAQTRSVVVREDGEVVGYAHLDVTDPVEGPSAELVVHPKHRGRGHARRLIEALIDESDRADPRGRLRLWAHGGQSAAGATARAMGFEQVRSLLQMRRSLIAALPAPDLPANVTVRIFRPGQDDAAWLELNAAAFADHPEQGGWTEHDLHRRLAEPWFDPAGFFLAEDAEGRLVGFHWTKIHGATHEHDGDADGHAHADPHGHEPIGEVYVLGVAPWAHGRGLGRGLTLVGLRFLRARGLTQAMLYVEADNDAAVRLYTRLGFAVWDTDVMYAR